MSRLLTVMAVLVAAVIPSIASAKPRPLQPPGAASEVFEVDAQGRTLRVDFPPHDRVWVAAGLAVGADPAWTASAGFNFVFDVDFPAEEIWWQLRHQVAQIDYRSGARSGIGLRLIEADYLRHDMSSTILVPARRDVRIPAPFDVGLQWALGGVDIAIDGNVTGLAVGDLAILADLVRDPKYLHRFAVGFESTYDVERPTGNWVHDVVPLSSFVVLWGWEHPRGLLAASLRPTVARVARVAVGGAPEWFWRTRTDFELEWVPLAVNDVPASMVMNAALEHEVARSTMWTLAISVRLSLPTGL